MERRALERVAVEREFQQWCMPERGRLHLEPGVAQAQLRELRYAHVSKETLERDLLRSKRDLHTLAYLRRFPNEPGQALARESIV